MLLLLAGCDGPEPADPAAAVPPRPFVTSATVPGLCEQSAARISEVVPGNVDGARDADGDLSDWLELVAVEPVDLAGFTLEAGDDVWTLPARSLSAGDLLLVWASGEERVGDELHAPFRIDAGGEDVELRAPDGCLADEVDLPFVPAGYSYGRPPGEELAFFEVPTPGAPNTTEHRPGFAATPRIEPPSAFGRTTLAVSGRDVHVALGGAVPSPVDPIETSIDVDPPVAGFAVVRARAFADGLWPSAVATATVGDPSVLRGLVTLALTSDPPDLFDVDRGIYTFGPPDYYPYYPWFGANFWEDWERPVHVAAFAPDGTPILAEDAGIAIHGGYSRAFDQRGLRLMGRDEYGDASFDHRFYAAEDQASFRTLQLHNGGDWCSTHLFDAFVHESLRDEDGARFPQLDAQAWEPVAVWLDGEYWGLYGLRERVDEHFLAAHHGVDPEALDRYELGAAEVGLLWEVEQGTWDAFDAFNAFARTTDLSDPAAWATFEAMAEPESLAAYVVAETYASNWDWWWNNVRLWRPATPDGRLRWILHDTGHGWPDPLTDHFATSVTWSGDGLPLADALANEEFRVLLLNTAADWLATTLSPAVAEARLDAMAARIRPEIPSQVERWCGTTPADWEASLEWARYYVRTRPAAMSAELALHLGVPGQVTLAVDVDPPGSGSVRLTSIDVDRPFAGLYFRDVPVTATAAPAPGFTFAGWSDGTEDTSIVLSMDGDTSIVARFE